MEPETAHCTAGEAMPVLSCRIFGAEFGTKCLPTTIKYKDLTFVFYRDELISVTHKKRKNIVK